MSLEKKLLFRADDLGYSEAVNYGMYRAAKAGLIKSVGVMLNMAATNHGVMLLKDFPIAFSQHTNICVGRPLSDPKNIPSLVDQNGFFKSSTVYRQSSEDFVDFDEVLIEIEAQYNKFLELFNRKPDYFEGHAVVSSNYYRALEYFAKKHDLKYSGLPENSEPNSLGKEAFIKVGDSKVYLKMDSMKKDYSPYDMFENVLNNLHQDGVDMLIFHPGYLDDFIVQHSSLLMPRVQEVSFLTDPAILAKIEEIGIELLSYKEL